LQAGGYYSKLFQGIEDIVVRRILKRNCDAKKTTVCKCSPNQLEGNDVENPNKKVLFIVHSQNWKKAMKHLKRRLEPIIS